MVYEYFFENISFVDLQNLIERVNLSNVGVTVIGASSSTAGVSSVIFEVQLSSQRLNRLISFMQTNNSDARFIRLEVLN